MQKFDYVVAVSIISRILFLCIIFFFLISLNIQVTNKNSRLFDEGGKKKDWNLIITSMERATKGHLLMFVMTSGVPLQRSTEH